MEEESGGGIPEWVVTFGDMMSLLLTFFIMLVSLSEIKEEEKYQAMVESVKRQFGYDTTRFSLIPGTLKARNSSFSKLATMGRARRMDIMKGGDKVKAPVGDYPRVRIIRPGTKTAIGTVIFFDEMGVELSQDNQNVLAEEIVNMRGKPQKIEIRGHTSRRPLGPDQSPADHWELAYERCRKTMRYLVDDLGVDPRRIRLSVAGPYEPLYEGMDKTKLRENSRVEIFLLDEVVEDLMGKIPDGQPVLSAAP